MPGFVVGLIAALHIAVCIGLMASILLQSGKGGGLAGTFGAGSSQTLFGGRGAATFLSRATTFLAVTFFLTSLTLGLQASRSAGTGGKSLIQEDARRRQQSAPTEAPAGRTPGPGMPQAPAGTPAPPPGSGAQAPAGNGTQVPATGGK